MRAQILNHYYVTSFCVVTIRNLVKTAILGLSPIILLLLASSSHAQPKFKVFNTESGLSSDKINCIVQDRSGYLWVGTENGLNRFDGNSFKVYKYSVHDKNSIAGNSITCLAVDNSNRIWIGNESDLTRYDPSTNHFTRYRVSSTGSIITFISFDRHNRIWVGLTSNGLLVLNPENGVVERRIDLTPFIDKNYSQREIARYNTVEGLHEDSSGNVWLATHDGLYLFDRKQDTVKPIRVEEVTPGKHRNDYFKGILDDHIGGFWFASYRGGVSHFSPKENLFNVYQTTPKQYDSDKDISFMNTVNDVVWKNEKELWLTTWDKDKSIGTFDTQTKKFSFLKSSDIFGREFKSTELLFNKMFVDRSGVVWVTSDMGLIMINPKNSWDFKPTFKSDTPFSISAIVEDTITEKRFLATFYGPGLMVSNVVDSTVRSYKGRVNPLQGDFEYIHDLLNTTGDSLWVVSADNIRLFDKVREKWIDLPELQKLEMDGGSVSPSFYRMIKASTGDYWIATRNRGAYALCRSDLSFVNFRTSASAENSICSNRLDVLLEDKFGQIWFASRNKGISILNPDNNVFRNLNSGKQGGSFLPTNVISDMDIDSNGDVWLATMDVGIIKIDVVSKDSLRIVTFDHELLTSPVNEIKIDAKDRVWFRSSGINVLEPKTMNVKFFESRSGLFDLDYALLKSNGRVFVSGSIGYGIIDEKGLLPDTTSSPLVINTIKVFGKEIYPEGTSFNQVRLPYDQNSIAIDFAAIDFLHNKSIKYSYKLEGLRSAEWSAPSSNRSTEFAQLAGGDYVFKLRTLNQEGVWSKEKDLLYIRIETPFWKTKWFYALLTGLFIGITALVYWYQITRIKIREKEKSEINKRISQLQLKALHTQMRPHFIFNCLSAINGHIVKFETVKASEFLSQFSKLMRGILENSTESWITLEQEIETLRLYLVMEGLRFEDKFSYKIEVEEGVNPSAILIPSMIVQPYVENAIGHGLLHKEHGIGTVVIKFLRGEGNIKCIIEDNGVGRERSGQIKQRLKISRKSLGLQITSERLQLLQGSSAADIQDLKNELGEPTGTRIIVMLMTKKVEDKDLVNLN